MIEPNADGVPEATGRMLSAIDRLYLRFDSMYMHKWRSYFASPDVIANWKKTWSTSLEQAGITPRIALDAIERCKSEYPKWAPTEGEFLALCKPPMDYEQAFHDALRELAKRYDVGTDYWPCPAIYWAAQDYGPHELRNASYGAAAVRWKRLLDKRLESVCPAVERPAAQVTAPARNAAGVAITSEQAKAAAMAALAALACRKPSRAIAIKNAKNILARQMAGEPVTFAQVAFAKEALDRLCPDEANEVERSSSTHPYQE